MGLFSNSSDSTKWIMGILSGLIVADTVAIVNHALSQPSQPSTPGNPQSISAATTAPVPAPPTIAPQSVAALGGRCVTGYDVAFQSRPRRTLNVTIPDELPPLCEEACKQGNAD